METLQISATNQQLKAVVQNMENTLDGIQARLVRTLQFIIAYRVELALLAVSSFFVMLLIYTLFFAPPMPPCKDIY